MVSGGLVMAACLAAAWSFARRGVPECRVGYVYDGDTIAMECGQGEHTARIMGLDTPETVRARCDAELAAGKRATDRLRALVAASEVTISRHGHDKYGRDLIRLKVDGEDVARVMIREGFALRYSGGARVDWCARLPG